MTITADVIVGLLGTGLMGIFIWMFKRQVNRIDDVEKKQVEIENNYLNRFDNLHVKLSESEKNIIREIGSLRTEMVGNFMPRAECKWVTEHFEKL